VRKNTKKTTEFNYFFLFKQEVRKLRLTWPPHAGDHAYFLFNIFACLLT